MFYNEVSQEFQDAQEFRRYALRAHTTLADAIDDYKVNRISRSQLIAAVRLSRDLIDCVPDYYRDSVRIQYAVLKDITDMILSSKHQLKQIHYAKTGLVGLHKVLMYSETELLSIEMN